MDREEFLENQLKEIRELKRKIKELRTLESYSPEEKCKKFDELFKFAQKIFDGAIGGDAVPDAEHYCFEEILELLGKNVWDIYNKLGRDE